MVVLWPVCVGVVGVVRQVLEAGTVDISSRRLGHLPVSEAEELFHFVLTCPPEDEEGDSADEGQQDHDDDAGNGAR